LINNLIDCLKGARFFTKLDVRWGFNNVRIWEGDEWKAAFRTNRGLFEPLVMYFDLTNSPATFQTMMNDIFQDLILSGNFMVYLDDILIAHSDLTCHREIVREVLWRLREHCLFLCPEKCEFKKSTIEYLSVIISHNYVEIDPVKVAGIAAWPEPENKKDVQQFLGFTNFYRRFIQVFLDVTQPLFDLTRKGVAWAWAWTAALAAVFQALILAASTVGASSWHGPGPCHGTCYDTVQSLAKALHGNRSFRTRRDIPMKLRVLRPCTSILAILFLFCYC
jgi:hypothetical protein